MSETNSTSATHLKTRSGPEALIIGVGNMLWADEGFGVRAVEAFAARYAVANEVELMDGGTTGLALIPDLAAAKRILIFDAVDFGAEPGELVIVHGEDVPKFAAGKKVSLHQTSMMEVLTLADVLADCPPEAITLIGCQPADMEDYGGGLTAPVAAQIDPALEAACRVLEDWGLTPRPNTASETLLLMPEAVNRSAYELERPDAASACRFGDERVLAQGTNQTGVR